jgi:hypothetical protein
LALNLQAEPILHIEWAAGNYAGRNQGKPELQFAALKNSLDEILAAYEPRGVIYINDLDPLGMTRAMNYAAEFLRGKGIAANLEPSVYEGAPVKMPEDGVTIAAYPGDIFLLPIPQTTTATLRNPEPTFVLLPLVTDKKDRILELAHASKTGLNVVVYQPLVQETPKDDWIAHLKTLNPEELPVSPDETYWDFASKADGHWMFYMTYRRFLLKACDGYLSTGG